MTRLLGLALIVFLLLPNIATALERSDIGETFYTRHTFKHEKRRYKTTNYLKGTLVPINSKVELLKYNRKVIIVRLVESGDKIRIQNVKKFSGATIDTIFDRIFSQKETDLGNFSRAVAKKIRLGVVDIGMTKKQVLMALGYPPAHETPSPDMDQWKYWKNRFNTMLISFDEDKVINVQD